MKRGVVLKNTYEINIAGLKRHLPLCPINENLYIGAFIIFGDVELTCHCASELLKIVPEHDVMITNIPSCKGILKLKFQDVETIDEKSVFFDYGMARTLLDFVNVNIDRVNLIIAGLPEGYSGSVWEVSGGVSGGGLKFSNASIPPARILLSPPTRSGIKMLIK